MVKALNYIKIKGVCAISDGELRTFFERYGTVSGIIVFFVCFCSCCYFIVIICRSNDEQ